jgi:hypothetical protein
MKRKYSKYIKKLFQDKFKEELPMFKPVKAQWFEWLFSYEFVISSKDSWKSIMIYHDDKDNSFGINLVWSIAKEPQQFRSTLVEHNLFGPIEINAIKELNLNEVSIGLADFWATDFSSGWAVDPTGKILKSIEKNGYITSDASFQFYSKDTFFSDEKELTMEEMKFFIDPLVDNAIKMIKQYGIPLFNALNIE